MKSQRVKSLLKKIGKAHGILRLVACLLVAVIVYFIVARDYTSQTNFLIGWDVFCLLMILTSWTTFYTISSAEIRKESQMLDESRIVVFAMIVVATIASMAAIFPLLTGNPSVTQVVIALGGMLLSWALIHTMFTFRYAHFYYRDSRTEPGTFAAGLEFPAEKNPDYIDFAYFSFVLGMTFQVSDVEISGKGLRRLSLFHSLVSFLFNTFIVALTVNVIGSLKGS